MTVECITSTRTETKPIKMNLKKLQEILDTYESLTPSKVVICFSNMVPVDKIIMGETIDLILDCTKFEKGLFINTCNKEVIMEYVKEHSTIWSSFIEIREPKI